MPNLSEHDRSRDAFYTPADIARVVIGAANVSPLLVLDPAVGDGALLRAAASRWPAAQVVGLDIDQKQVNRTRAAEPDWTLGRTDMLSSRSRAASAVWRTTAERADLVVMNPPFSYRGGRSREVDLGGGNAFALTPASAFVALGLTRLAARGELLAVLPAGVLALERDATFWDYVGRTRDIDTVAEFSSTAFSGTRTRSILVAVRAVKSENAGEVVDLPVRQRECVELIRGRVPVHRVRADLPSVDSVPFLHTRDLGTLTVEARTTMRAHVSLATRGPFLTVPRVGRVLSSHLKIVSTPPEVVLSDCVFALRSESDGVLESLRSTLLDDLLLLQRDYVGGCAPYLTINRLSHFLGLRGYCVHHVSASAPVGGGKASLVASCAIVEPGSLASGGTR